MKPEHFVGRAGDDAERGSPARYDAR